MAWDDRLKGFGVRVKSSGARSYVLQYRNAAGVSRRFTIGRHGELTAEQARTTAAKMLAEIRLGADPARSRKEQRRAETVGELVEIWLAEKPSRTRSGRPKKQSSWATDEANLRRHVVPLLGRRDAAGLTRADIERWKRDVAAGKTAADERTRKRGRARVSGGAGVAGRALDSLASMLAWAVGEGIIHASPASGVKRYQPRRMQRFLSAEELARLGEAVAAMESEGALHPYAAAVIRLLATTGCRKGEILGLQWPFVDFERRVLDLRDSKTGERPVPLGAAALAVLADLARIKSAAGQPAWVFPAGRGALGHYSFPYRDWQRVAARAGLANVRLHDLRHSFASLAVSSGTSLYVLSKLLGHSSQRMSERYAHLGDDPLRAAADATARRVADAMNGGNR